MKMRTIARRILAGASLLSLLAGCSSYSPVTTGAVVGGHWLKEPYAEIGVARYSGELFSGGPCSSPGTSGVALTSELKLTPGFIMGTQASAWFTLIFLDAGINAIYYTDFHEGALVVRPEIGLGDIVLGRVAGKPVIGKLVFGYNIGRSMKGINNGAELGLRTIIPF